MSTLRFQTPEECHQLRMALRRALPEGAMEPEPLRGVIALAVVPLYVALMVPIVTDTLPWWADLALAVVIGQLVTHVGLAAHETLHRSTFRSKFWMELHGWVGFAWYLFGPGLWHAWHVLSHHGHTQEGAADPDLLVTTGRLRDSRLAAFVHAVTPGSGHPISWISLSFLFTLQGQLYLWFYIDQPEFSRIRMDRTRERLTTVALLFAWTALAVWMGPWPALCCIAIPMATSNATLMMYIATNHWLRPVTPAHNNPFLNTTSVTVPAWVDALHVQFSYHQEHHIFPAMSLKHGPALRRALTELAPDAVCAWPLGAVLRQLYLTPSVYLDDHTLGEPDGSGSITVEAVAARFEAADGAGAFAQST
jgi:fatty acid desaturase